jgi:hypothetical protein
MANTVAAPGFREIAPRKCTDRWLRIGSAEVDQVGSGFGANVQLFVKDIEMLSKKFPGMYPLTLRTNGPDPFSAPSYASDLSGHLGCLTSLMGIDFTLSTLSL